MSAYRTIKTTFWSDPYIDGMDPRAKLFYLYLFTNPYTNNLGVMEVSLRKMAFETGLSEKQINECLETLEKDGKVVRDDSLIWMTKFIKNQTTTSPKILISLKNLISSLESNKILSALTELYPELLSPKGKDTVCNGSRYGIDTVSIPYKNGIGGVPIPSGELELELERELESTNTKRKAEEEAPPPAAPTSTAFEFTLQDGSKAGLLERDVKTWEKAYQFIHVRTQLQSMADQSRVKRWWSRKEWFHALSACLARANEQAVMKMKREDPSFDPDDPRGDKAAQEDQKRTRDFLRSMVGGLAASKGVKTDPVPWGAQPEQREIQLE